MELEYNSIKYKYSLDLSKDQLFFKIESSDQKITYQEHFSFERLQKVSELFSKDINNCIELIKKFLKNKLYNIKIENNDMIIHFDNITHEFDMKLPLKEKNFNFNKPLGKDIQNIIKSNELVLGIDFGTTYSTSSVMIDKVPIAIPNDVGQLSTPSYISFIDDKSYFVGELAKLTPSFDKNTIYGIKRLIGRKYNENYYDKSFEEIKRDQDFPFEIIKDPNSDKIKIVIEYEKNNQMIKKDFYPEQLCALILKKIKNNSEYYLTKKLGKNITINNAVITVPAYFNQLQRKAIKESAEIINLNVKRIINEPTAASLAYGYEKETNESNSILVIDFGGGTLDITTLYFNKNENGIFCDIKSSSGHSNLGGDDFDLEIMKYCLEQNNLDNSITKNLSKSIRLKKVCERAKIELSCESETEAVIKLENYQNLKDINTIITREKFNEISSKLFEKFENLLDKVIKDYKDMKIKSEITKIILVGGTTFIPKVKDIVQKKFPKINILENKKDDILYSVSKGAAILGAKESKKDNVKEFYLSDIVNLPLGVEIEGGIMSPIIKKNKKIDFDESQIYITTKDNQTVADIFIYEGEKEKVKDNFYLGKFSIKNLPKKNAGEAQIKIQFLYDQDSIVYAKAFDLSNINNFEEKKIEQIKIFNDAEIKHFQLEVKEMNEIYIFEYDMYKYEIISLEEKIRDNKEEQKHMLDLINKLADLLEKNYYSAKITISFVKYYFWKIHSYITYTNKNKIKVDNSFYELMKKIIKKIIDNIQFYNENIRQENAQISLIDKNSYNILEEVTDELIDNDELFYFFLKQLVINYVEKVKEYIYTVNLAHHMDINDICNISYNHLIKVEKIISKLKEKSLGNEILNYIKMKEDLENLLEILKLLSLNNFNNQIVNYEKTFDAYKTNSLKHLIDNYIGQYYNVSNVEIKDIEMIDEYISKAENLENNNIHLNFIVDSLFFILNNYNRFENNNEKMNKNFEILCAIKGQINNKFNLGDLDNFTLEKLHNLIMILQHSFNPNNAILKKKFSVYFSKLLERIQKFLK